MSNSKYTKIVDNTGVKSDVWKHYGLPVVDGKIDKTVAVCKLCNADVKRQSNTSNLRHHLNKWHPVIRVSLNIQAQSFAIKPSNNTL